MLKVYRAFLIVRSNLFHFLSIFSFISFLVFRNALYLKRKLEDY